MFDRRIRLAECVPSPTPIPPVAFASAHILLEFTLAPRKLWLVLPPNLPHPALSPLLPPPPHLSSRSLCPPPHPTRATPTRQTKLPLNLFLSPNPPPTLAPPPVLPFLANFTSRQNAAGETAAVVVAVVVVVVGSKIYGDGVHHYRHPSSCHFCYYSHYRCRHNCYHCRFHLYSDRRHSRCVRLLLSRSRRVRFADTGEAIRPREEGWRAGGLAGAVPLTSEATRGGTDAWRAGRPEAERGFG